MSQDVLSEKSPVRPLAGPNVIGNAEDESMQQASSEENKLSPEMAKDEEQKERILMSDDDENM